MYVVDNCTNNCLPSVATHFNVSFSVCELVSEQIREGKCVMIVHSNALYELSAYTNHLIEY